MSILELHVDPSRGIRRLSHLSNLPEKLAPAMKDAVLYVHSVIPGYPPGRGTRYVRTGTLGRSVTSLQGGAPGALSRVESLGGIVGYVGTNIKYAPYVIDKGRQAWMHRGRWWVLQDVVHGAAPGIVRILQAAISKLTQE